MPELTDKSNEECAEAKELASQIQFKNSKPSEEHKSQPELIRRNVANSSTSVTSSDNLQTNTVPVNNLIHTSTTQTFNNTTLVIMIVLSGLFIFLLLRRIYLIVDRNPYSV